MAKEKETNKPTDEQLAGAIERPTSITDFFEDNKDLVTYLLGGLFVIVIGFLVYRQFIQAPKETESIEQMAQAQRMFEQDSFALALTNPGNGYPGFADIAEDYSGTKAGNLALYYAGVSYLNLGQFDAAIDYLEDFSPAGDISPTMRAGALGDAYAEKGQPNKALSQYKKAASGTHPFLASYYLKKYGMLSEKQGDLATAREAYETIKTEYHDSPFAADIEKYLGRVQE